MGQGFVLGIDPPKQQLGAHNEGRSGASGPSGASGANGASGSSGASASNILASLVYFQHPVNEFHEAFRQVRIRNLTSCFSWCISWTG